MPTQKYLDGIAVGQGTVRQFIAMPIGSGYSVEKQVTGKEDVGGMQLEIIPGNQWYVRPKFAQNTTQGSAVSDVSRIPLSSNSWNLQSRMTVSSLKLRGVA